ncbi:MAG TPA: iron-sulfur cluster assembly accessory protein [Polyangiaceae bacterium]|nr:iron-sulfur cluster assembly accessory protein [Polyangiaceae bacterium]
MSQPTQTTEASPATEDASRIRVTPEAVAYAKRKLGEIGKPNAALRVGVKGGGCAGLTYVTDFTEDPPQERDLVYEFFGLPVYVDQRSIKFLEGSVLRFENTLMYQGFKFDNPLQESSCGCGQTFSVKKNLKTL